MDTNAETTVKGVRNVALRRLAHFDPTCTDEYGHQVLDYLLLDALATLGELEGSPRQVASIIRRVFIVEFEEAEITTSAEHLQQSGLVTIRRGSHRDSPMLRINPKAAQQINRNVDYVKSLEEQVLADWESELRARYQQYDVVQKNIQSLVEVLQRFMSEMFYRHGVECVALLYPDEKKTAAWLTEIKSGIFDHFPHLDPFLSAVARYEIPKFFESDDQKRREYTTSLLNSSFFWHLMQVDESCSRLLRDATTGQQLFLDNNIIYSLVGFHGAEMLQSVHRMLHLAVELGYELWVTTKTLDEFYGSLQYQMRELKSRPALPAELARIALRELGERSFLTAYWREFVEHATSIEDFVAERGHLKELFSGLGINTTDEWREEIEGSEHLRSEMVVLRSVCAPWVSDRVVEHDAFHRVFIERKRGAVPYQFSEAVAWFLTHDRKLPHYSRVARRGQNQLPFCLTTDQWVQLNRPLLTRTADADAFRKSFHILVTEPFLRSMMAPFQIEVAYNEVLGRLARYKHMSPQLALDIVAQKQFMFRLAEETDQVSEKLDMEIEDQFVKLAEKLQREKAVSDENRAIAEKEASRLRTKVAFQLLSIRWMFTAALLGISSLGLWFHQKLLGPSPLHEHRNGTLIAIALQLFLTAMCLNIPLRKHWKVWVPSAVAFLILVLTLAAT